MDLQNKGVVLTGSSSGIGLELLFLLAKKDCKILAVDKIRPAQKLSNVFYLTEDISTKKGINSVFSKANKVLGEVDIFIANAGFAYFDEASKASWEKADNIFSTNVYSPIYSFLKLKDLKKDKAFQFVATGSAMSYIPLPGYSLYSGSKHALKGFFESARTEMLHNQIITLIYPIATKTSFYKKGARVPFPNQKAETVARQYLRGIEKNKKSIYPSKSFWLVKHLSFLQPLVQKLENHYFKIWKENKK